MDRLEAMSILLLTIDKGSFTAAARTLGMPLPTVSRKVSELEAHLGVQLLVRSTRRLALTEAGAAYAETARRILGEVEEAERVAAGEFAAPRGELVITAPVLFGQLHVLPIVTEFLAAYPEIRVRFLLSDRNLHLIEDHIDMAVRIGSLPDSSMVATRVGEMPTVLCASPALLVRQGMPQRPEDLVRFPCIGFEGLAARPTWRFKRAERRFEMPVSPRLTVTTAAAAVLAAEQGVGATQLYRYQCEEALGRGALRAILTAFQPDAAPVSLLHAARGALPLKMRVFLDYAARRLRARLTQLSSSAA